METTPETPTPEYELYMINLSTKEHSKVDPKKLTVLNSLEQYYKLCNRLNSSADTYGTVYYIKFRGGG